MQHGHRILLLEDDAGEARRSRDALTENGYAVTLAASLAAARRAIKRDPSFDLVIADHHLPDGEGPRIIPSLRAAGSQAPVILVTANRSERVAAAAFAAGCADTAIKELDYHSWLPKMAEAFVAAAACGPDGDAARWGPHVKGVCVGRVHGHALQASSPALWEPYGRALQGAAELALRAVRANGQSALGSQPVVHVQVRETLHLVLALRGGVFAAALMDRVPTPEDQKALFEEATAFARARSQSGDADSGAAAL